MIKIGVSEKQITNKTKGIVLAHTLGNPFNLEKSVELGEKYELFLMEDMCDAFGSKYDEKNVGTYQETRSWVENAKTRTELDAWGNYKQHEFISTTGWASGGTREVFAKTLPHLLKRRR